MSRKQLDVRDRLQRKIDAGCYGLVDSPCLCGHGKDVLLSEVDRYGIRIHFVICKECGLIRMNPRLDSASFESFYKNEYRTLFMEFDVIPETYFNKMVATGRDILQLLTEVCPDIRMDQMSVLDVGCSAGGCLMPFLLGGARVKGLDYDEAYLTYGNKMDPRLNLCRGGIEELKSDHEKYDFIICNHVLEHLADPLEAITVMRGHLKHGGVLFLGVPHLRDLAHYASRSKSFLGALHISHAFCFSTMPLLNLVKPMKLLYMDDGIRALLVHEPGVLEPEIRSEYEENMAFLIRHEMTLAGKLDRFGFLIKEFATRFVSLCLQRDLRLSRKMKVLSRVL